MAKRKMVYCLPVAALALGAGVLMSAGVHATTGSDMYGCDDEKMDDVQVSCMATSLDSLKAGLALPNIENIYTLSSIDVKSDVTLDLSGKTIKTFSNTNGYDMFEITDGASLTISGNGTVVKEGVAGNIFVVKGESSTLQLNGGTYNTNAAGRAVYGAYLLEGGTIIINNGATIDTTGSAGAAISGNNTTGDAHITVNGGALKSRYPSVYMAGQVDLTMNGGSLEGGIFARMGQIEINGGTITGIKEADDVDSLAAEYATSGMVWTGDAIAVYGGTYSYDHDAYGNSLNLKIKGGNLNATNGNAVAIYDMGKVAQEMNVEVSGGTLNAGASDTVKTYWIKDEVATPKAGYGEIRNNINIEISGGEFATEPDASEIADGMEAEQNESTGTWEILPKMIGMQENGAMVSDETLGGALAGQATFVSEFVADRKASFEVSTLDDDEISTLVLDATKGGDLVLPFDASLRDRNGVAIDVNGASIVVRVALTEEQYNALVGYDGVKVAYFDNEGVEQERLDATLGVDGDGAYHVEFTTTHLSTYGIVGVNGAAAAAETSEATDAAAPETGTVTREGGSAMAASLVTVIAVAVIASVAGCVAFLRRR